ncbi:TetR/AcrR family transcriptional regulator [Vitiosangium sp. GDMCC 1.1324]|uniref:TetR/AcrR family transcriptional regulator n=1 Tax=Vitiosangium sp. (strain GDMCC 1.1324) TaxID=2138576 RepID=UPI000D3C7AB6|nr:TetR/AcrR family transcriptional regulator [Vitiosangium sp. GDMCC 1.1324]PTL78077.1 TetR/AcrR family transcriptional regulator [Vitiosangium sp. GDMCC 1.1324]
MRKTPAELSPTKRAQILSGASAVFSDLGYERASVDAIAARAGVSKATIYNHFEDKKALFLACLSEEGRALEERLREVLDTPSGDLERDLQLIGEAVLRLLLSPATLKRYRIFAAQVDRFPELGVALFEHGLRPTQLRMTRYLERASATGALRLEDPAQAALDFLALCQGDIPLRAQLGVLESLTDEQIRARVAHAARVFLCSYRP